MDYIIRGFTLFGFTLSDSHFSDFVFLKGIAQTTKLMRHTNYVGQMTCPLFVQFLS